jgi:hypothetical protein
MTAGFQFTTPERAVELFHYCIGQLKTQDDGLAPGHDEADLETCAFLCRMVKALAIVPRDVHDLALFELADATEALIVTAVLPPEGDVVGRWIKARVSVLESQLGAL